MILYPYTIPGLINPTPDLTRAMATAIAPKGFTIQSAMYPVSGTDQDWHFHTHGTLALLYEGSDHNPLDIGDREQSTRQSRETVRALLGHTLNGHRLAVRVINEEGQGVRASIAVDEITTYEGEPWRTRPDGQFDLLVPQDGNYTVRATTDEGSGELLLTAGAERALLTIQTTR